MIAKAKVIQHGHNAINYAVNKENAKIIKLNFLPQGITPDAMWQRMMLHQSLYEHLYNKHRTLKNNMIRIEVSPRKEETPGWSIDDWKKLAKEFVETFDSINLTNRAKRTSAKSTNLTNSQYIVALHTDSKSGIYHLHIDANRVDMNGNINDAHFIYERAMMAAKIINQKRGWFQAVYFSKKNKLTIAFDCYAVLQSMTSFNIDEYFRRLASKGYEIRLMKDSRNQVRGYSIKMGNSIYKSSEIGSGRKFMPSKLEATWATIHPIQNKQVTDFRTDSDTACQSKQTSRAFLHQTDDSSSNCKEYGPEKIRDIAKQKSQNCKYSVFDNTGKKLIEVSPEIDTQIRQELEASLNVGNNEAETFIRIQKVAVALFVGYIDAALTMSESYGGGGTVPSNWGKDDEDDRLWAQKCAKKAIWLCKPRMRYGRGR